MAWRRVGRWIHDVVGVGLVLSAQAALAGLWVGVLAAPLVGQSTRDSVACVKCVAVRDSTRDSTAVTTTVPVTSWRVTTRVTTTWRDSVVRVPVPPTPPPATPTLVLTATPNPVVAGQPVTISWRATNTTGSCVVRSGSQTASGQPLEATHQTTLNTTTTVRVTCGALTQSVTIQVTAAPTPPPPAPPPPPPVPPAPPVGGLYPNRPANFTRVLSDFGFDTAIPVGQEAPIGDGWRMGRNRQGTLTRSEDPTAPRSPQYVWQSRYPAGMAAGGDIGIVYRSLPRVSRVYVATWVKHDPQFQFNSISNKYLYLEPGNIILQTRHWEHYWPVWVGGRGLDIWPTRVAPIPLGQWQLVEWLVDATAGQLRVWVDGVLVTSYNGTLPGNWEEMKLDTTYGGGSGSPSRDIFRWVDHIFVATTP